MADHDDPLRHSSLNETGAGLASAGPRPYIRAMRYFARLSPVAAYRDLRRFLATRERYELIFLVLALAITGGLMLAFVHDKPVEVPYKREIIYVQQWRADRTDAQIKVQQAIDEAAKQKQKAIDAAEREKLRLKFKRLDDSLTNMGI